jgi:CRISPR-associated protein Csd1
MGWLQKLIETYDVCAGADQFSANSLPPISHTPQQAHIEIVIDEHGNFRRARILQKEEALIPATEESAGRVGTKPPPHPLCDKIQYVAADYPTHGGTKPSFHTEYLEQLTAWCVSPFAHPKAQAVLDYVRRGRVVNDLVREQLLYLDSDGTLLTQWPAGAPKPDIFRFLPAGNTDQGNAFIRWQVEILHDPASTIAYRHVVDGGSQIVAGDPDLQSAWVRFNASQMQQKGLCMASGEAGVALAGSHPKRLRHPGDGAKLISSNDKSGFTFRGRFTDDSGDQACTIGYGASQKAHLALRWLIGRQAYRNGDQVVVSWSVGGQEIPDPLADPFTLFGIREAPAETAYEGDAGQAYALALKLKIAGYLSRLPPSASIIVMALDSATPGRLSIVFYREFGGAEFLNRIEAWHEWFAWHQKFSKDRKFIGAPAPRDIAEAAYGPGVDDRLRKACVERLLPCLVDGQPIPRDLVEATFRRASRRIGLEVWDWERTLGVACALFRGYHHQLKQGNFAMALEPDRNSRDYLFGRLLSYADHIEQRALRLAGEQRDTNAAKLMQRFADHPSSTWRQINGQLGPSRSRLRSRSPGYLHLLEQQIDQIFGQFQGDDFTNDRKLTAEFLLGYHCQRASLSAPKPSANSPEYLALSDPEETS